MFPEFDRPGCKIREIGRLAASSVVEVRIEVASTLHRGYPRWDRRGLDVAGMWPGIFGAFHDRSTKGLQTPPDFLFRRNLAYRVLLCPEDIMLSSGP